MLQKSKSKHVRMKRLRSINLRRRWILSPIFFILSFFTKAFVAPYFIMTLFFAGRTSISSKKKLGIFISYIAIIGIAAIVIFSGDTIYPNVIHIDYSKFFVCLATFGPLLRYDLLLILSIFPVVIGLTFLAKNSTYEIDTSIGEERTPKNNLKLLNSKLYVKIKTV